IIKKNRIDFNVIILLLKIIEYLQKYFNNKLECMKNILE
ncbi:hypothetical protein A5875_003417, partial [Enterococcus sp. 3H8_DIV0648]